MYKALQLFPMHKTMDLVYQSYEKPTKHLLLEPLSCIVRLCLLSYKSPGTKISIVQNGISYNEPSFTQGLFRSWYGDNREDLHNLCYPIHYFAQWYPYTESQYRPLYEKCKTGLMTLKEAYEKHSTIHHTLTHYISLLETPLTESTTLSKPHTNPVIQQLQDIWSEDEKTLLLHLLHMISTTSSPEQLTYISTCEDILSHKETFVHTHIQTLTTEY